MDHNQNIENNKNANTSTIQIKATTAILVAIFIYFDLVPLKVGLTNILLLFITSAIRAVAMPGFNYCSQHFGGLTYAFSPIWVLYLEPCAGIFATWNSVAGAIWISFGLTNRFHRIFYTSLMAISWSIVSWNAKNMICMSEKPQDILHGNYLYTILSFVIIVITMCKYSDSHLRDIKASLDQVKELNKKFEALNHELKQTLEDKDNFILLFSHETRNPLNILLGNLTLLLDETESPGVKSKLMRCKFCANLLLHYLNNVLDSGKLSNNGILEVTPAATKIHEYIYTTMNFMEMLVKKKENLKAELMIPQRLPRVLKFDTQRLTQVILNLLTNAVKFTESGKISLVVRYLRKSALGDTDYYPTTAMGYSMLNSNGADEGDLQYSILEFCNNPLGSGIQNKEEFQRHIPNRFEKKESSILNNYQKRGYLKIEVSDTGCGMKPEELGALYRKFSQVHTEGSHRQIGTGLGLWITKTLCNSMGGDIKAFSRPNVGTTFVAIIEADTLPSPGFSIRLASQSQNNFKQLLERRVLVVDDDPFNLDFHIHILKGFGFDLIETASDGEKLVEKFMVNPEGYYETLITDVRMPKLGGIKAAQLIREFERTQRRKMKVNIGFITGHPNHNDKLVCESHPINALFYLSKPVNPNTIESFLLQTHSTSSSKVQLTSTSFGTDQPAFHLKRSMVLCVDDDLYNLDCLEQLLKSLGAQVIKGKSGEEGLAILKKIVHEGLQELCFILMDCRMPGLDGWETSHEMKLFLRSQGAMSIPIIGVSGDSRKENEEKFKWSGMDQMLQKPITRDDLKSLLEKYA